MRPINLIKGAKQMKAVVMHEYGGPDVLKYEDVPDPVPGEGEVLIRMAAASINPVDLWQRAGTTKASLRVEFPGIIGWDLSGTVVGLGPEVREFDVGDNVFALAFHYVRSHARGGGTRLHCHCAARLRGQPRQGRGKTGYRGRDAVPETQASAAMSRGTLTGLL